MLICGTPAYLTRWVKETRPIVAAAGVTRTEEMAQRGRGEMELEGEEVQTVAPEGAAPAPLPTEDSGALLPLARGFGPGTGAAQHHRQPGGFAATASCADPQCQDCEPAPGERGTQQCDAAEQALQPGGGPDRMETEGEEAAGGAAAELPGAAPQPSPRLPCLWMGESGDVHPTGPAPKPAAWVETLGHNASRTPHPMYACTDGQNGGPCLACASQPQRRTPKSSKARPIQVPDVFSKLAERAGCFQQKEALNQAFLRPEYQQMGVAVPVRNAEFVSILHF
jgi:hypothetical protein